MAIGFYRNAQPLVMAVALFAISVSSLFAQVDRSKSKKFDSVQSTKLGNTKNVHVCGNLFTAGQFTKDDLSKIKDAGITRVISLRTLKEISWDEKKVVESKGLKFQQIPFYYPDSLTDKIFDDVRTALADKKTKTLLHCGAASRVAAVWLPYRVLDEGRDLEVALKEAKQIGNLPKGYETKALDYIKRKIQEKKKTQQEKKETRANVPKGINKNFLDPKMNVKNYLKMFEIESREIYTSRYELLKACKIEKDFVVADVGAGTGLFTRLFSIEAKDGWVYAIDISPKFLEHIRKDTKKFKLKNVSPLLCQEDSVNLPPNSVDLVFICDTYHHFEFPKSTLKSIHTALKDGGTIVLIDFERIPGVTKRWIIGHVRAGKGVFRSEVEKAGFQFVEEVKVRGLSENYFLRFRKQKSK